ncbi:hypothetical protein K474DRAFT_827583 [Panus rudis PR-1116 ss-1]|nr:hypothetical protein K474DRAFT_827583 [Panus rudis PR-1116 ss-1]
MSQGPKDATELDPENGQEEVDEGEESDEYDNIEEEEGDEDDEGLANRGSSLTALLLGGNAGEGNDDGEGDDDDEDDEYQEPTDITGPGVPGPVLPPPTGKKRARDDPEEEEDVSGDYGEFEENSETVNKKARAAAGDSES